MTDDGQAARARMLAAILSRSGLPNAPLAMPRQVLESQPGWLFAIYSRFVRRA